LQEQKTRRNKQQEQEKKQQEAGKLHFKHFAAYCFGGPRAAFWSLLRHVKVKTIDYLTISDMLM
jgi:hypothetical protein